MSGRFFRGSSVVCSIVLVLAAMLQAQRAAAAEPSQESVQHQMMQVVPSITKFLHSKGYKNVGVLKFRIKKGNEPVSDRVGTLNTLLADQLELALLLKINIKEDSSLGIIHKASDVAAKIPGATHLTADGRKKLLDGKYPLAWGDEKVTPDALITGVAIVSADLREMSVNLLCVSRSSGELEKIGTPFSAKVDAAALSELGESFALRGIGDGGEVKLTETEAVETAAKVKAKQTSYPLSDPTTPIKLEIYYDGKLAPINIKDGQAQVAEPRDGQKVTLRIKRNSSDGKRYGVVLKVNGENTLFREKNRDIDCRRWIIEKTQTHSDIIGYQKDDKKTEEFKVLSRQEAQKNDIYYGDDVGLISMTVFVERTTPEPAAKLTDAEDADMLAISRGVFPDQPANQPAAPNLAALRNRMESLGTRGPMAPGVSKEQGIQLVKFSPDPTPVMSVVVRYFKP